MIQKKGKKYLLISRKNGKVLGKHPSKEAALRQEQAIEISKHKRQR